VAGAVIHFSVVIPFVILLSLVILVKEGLTVVRKYLVENIATQTDKAQTIQVIERLLKVDIGGFIYQQQIGSLYRRIFRSIAGLISVFKLAFLDFMPVFFAALAAMEIAFLRNGNVLACAWDFKTNLTLAQLDQPVAFGYALFWSFSG
jgi:ATP-binding cassette subfamily B protein